MDLYKRKLNKIKRKIDSITKVGTDNFLEYYKYVDELINKGDYSTFQELLQIEYNIDTYEYRSVLEMREDTYKMITEQTKSDFLQKITKFYKQNKVFQQSFNIYSDETGKIIGSIKEVLEKSDFFEYYSKNKQYARLIGEYVTFLEVSKIENDNIIGTYLENNNNPEWTENQNLLERYKRAINFIIK